ncbi:MAG: type I-E CRISPR-associated protein Cse1/CasA [Desulfobulbaceae bacterium]|nr:type I-E CRISPR-associated protein Cse1/CasA [Desulfobulbaceae bacterium]
MNVAFDPWIPVVTMGGNRELASLSEIFSDGGKYADLAVRPHERVSLMRLLLCIAHAALDGPKDYDEWCEVPDLLPDAAVKYLADWKDSFELFHPVKPWLQIAELSHKSQSEKKVDDYTGWTPVSKLNFSFATGNTSTLFDHEGAIPETRDIPLYVAVVSMVAFQCFSVGGLMGQVFWKTERCGELANLKKENGPVKSSDGPCSPSSMLHATLRGKTLTQTISLNIPTIKDIKVVYEGFDIGRPVWEKMPKSISNCPNIPNATNSYLGRLVPLTRVILFHPSGQYILLGNGFPYKSYISGFPQEPTSTVVSRDNKRFLLSYRPSKAIWRELAAITMKRKADCTGGPVSLAAIQDGHGCDLVVSALARNKATIMDAVESIFLIPPKLFLHEAAASYEEEVKKAETLVSRLGWAIETYRRELDPGWEGKLKASGSSKGKLKERLHSVATIHYWTTVENNLPLLMEHIESIGTEQAIPTREQWRKMLFRAALDAYTIACGQETPRQMKAFSKGWQVLVKRKDTETNVKKQKEDDV